MSQPKKLFLGLILLLFAVSFVYTRFSYLNSGIMISEPDEWYWHNSSQSLVTNIYIPKIAGKPEVLHPPLFEYLGYFISMIVPESKYPLSFESTRLVSVFSSLILAVVMYLYLKGKVGQKEALFSLFLIVLTPIFLFYSKVGLHDMLLTLMVFVFYTNYEKLAVGGSNTKLALLTGISLAVAVAAKNAALIFFTVPVLYLAFGYLQGTKTSLGNWRNFFKLKLFIKRGQKLFLHNLIVLATASFLIFLFNLPALIFYRRLLKDGLLLSTIAHSGNKLSQMAVSFNYYSTHLIFWLSLPFIFLVVLGLIHLLSRRFGSWKLLVIFISLISLFLITNGPAGRYFLLLMPFLTIVATLGFRWLGNFFAKNSPPKMAILASILIILMLPGAYVALESTNHSLMEQAVRYIRKEQDQGFGARFVFSSFWPTIFQESVGYPTVRFTLSLDDANADYNEYPTFSPKVEKPPIQIIQEERSFVVLHKPPDSNDYDARRDAAFLLENNLKPTVRFEDGKPNFPDTAEPYHLELYKLSDNVKFINKPLTE